MRIAVGQCNWLFFCSFVILFVEINLQIIKNFFCRSCKHTALTVGAISTCYCLARKASLLVQFLLCVPVGEPAPRQQDMLESESN